MFFVKYWLHRLGFPLHRLRWLDHRAVVSSRALLIAFLWTVSRYGIVDWPLQSHSRPAGPVKSPSSSGGARVGHGATAGSSDGGPGRSVGRRGGSRYGAAGGGVDGGPAGAAASHTLDDGVLLLHGRTSKLLSGALMQQRRCEALTSRIARVYHDLDVDLPLRDVLLLADSKRMDAHLDALRHR